jgi:hypothetical protein
MEFDIQPKHPWFKIWINPRGTIREIIDYNPNYLVIPIALLSGLAQALDRSIGSSLGDDFDLRILIPVIIIIGPILGIIGLYVGGAILSWFGQRLGGQGSQEEVRTALAWSSMPQLLILILDIGLIALLGTEAFTSSTHKMDARIEQSLIAAIFYSFIFIGILFITVVLAVWSIFLYIKCLAEAHQFSSWRSIATILIPSAVFVIIVLICLVPIFI